MILNHFNLKLELKILVNLDFKKHKKITMKTIQAFKILN